MYRGDIEGLRAVAVIPVLLFHFGLTGFTGGYVGVDIFFVISGYLISTILLREIKNNQFSVFGFYDRRVRRIFPALVFVVGITTVFSYFFLLPREFQDYGQSLLATSLFSSNFLFWMEAGYFDAESHSKPLLHTWSLAVEEQYYLFYPLLLAFAYRLGRVTLVAILCLLASLSFMVSVWLSAADSSSAFYLLHSRLWELLIGSIIAIHGFKPLRSKLLNEILSIVALVAIAYPIIFFDHSTLFPGPWALLPCLGVGLLIYVGETKETLVGRILNLAPLRHIGGLSYSLYLWHWPIFVFLSLYLDRPFEIAEVGLLLLLTYASALFSLRYVEKPFRGNKSGISSQTVFGGAAAFITVCISLGLSIHIAGGMPSRLSQETLATVNLWEEYQSKSKNCLLKHKKIDASPLSLCRLGGTERQQNFIFWGDSHAAAMAPGLQNAGLEKSGNFIGMQGCPPLFDISISRNSPNGLTQHCHEFNEKVLKYILLEDGIDVVVLAAYWTLYFEGNRLETDPNHGSVYLAGPNSTLPLSVANNKDILKNGLSNLIERLTDAGKDVVLIGPVPEIDVNGVSSIARAQIYGRETMTKANWQPVHQRIGGLTTFFEDIELKTQVKVVFPHRFLCAESWCQIKDAGGVFYHDRHHLSPHGARTVLQEIGLVRILEN